METTKKKRSSLSAYSILFIILILVAILSWIFKGAGFQPVVPSGQKEAVSAVTAAGLPEVLMSIYNGFVNAIDIAIFVLILGGFLNVVNQTGALEAGVSRLVNNMKGRELILIGVLMFLFSIGGTTYGMCEETVAFYALMTTTMVAAGFDTLVAVGTILLGAGSGCLGSTVNPFAVGVAIDSLKSAGIATDKGTIILLGTILWLVSTGICMFFVMRYAIKVQKDKGSTLLSLQEQKDMKEHFSGSDKKLEFTGKHKLILWVFLFTFVVMIASLIPWSEFGIHIFEGWSSFLFGKPIGEWYFPEISVWFFLMTLVMALIAGLSERDTVKSFIKGSSDILSVVLIIAVARAVSVLMAETHIDALILDRASGALEGLPVIGFVLLSFLVYLALSFFVPSTSGLATFSMPVMGGLAHKLGLSPEVMIMIFCAASGILNYVTPTSGVVMGGLEVSKVELKTWWKFMTIPLIVITVVCAVILVAAMYIF